MLTEPLVASPSSGEAHWVSSVDAAMRTTQIAAVAGLQLAFAAAVASSEIRGPWLVAFGLHLLVGAVGIGVLLRRVHPGVFLAAHYGMLAVDFAIAATIDEPLVAMAFAGASITSVMPILLYRGLWPLVVSWSVAALLCVCIKLAHPEWASDLTIATAATALAMSVAAVAFMDALWRFAARADQYYDEAEQERQRVVTAKAANDAAAEDTRVLHDTVINTLGALAVPGLASHAPSLVRERCRHDVDRVEMLLQTGVDTGAASWLFGFDDDVMDGVHRSGLSKDELRRYEALLPSSVARAMQGCVLEVVTNATKHAHATHVGLDVRRTGSDLVIVVVDDGVGFDGQLVPGRGLAESVFARAEAHGIHVELDTAPGRGTRVTLRYTLADTAAESPADEPIPTDDMLNGVRREACWVWCIVAVWSGLVAGTISSRGNPTLGHLTVLIVGSLSALSWLLCRDGRTLPRWLAVVLIGAAPTTFVLGLVAVDFGRDHAFLFPATGLTPLFIILQVTSRRRWPVVAASALLAVAAAIALVGVSRDNPRAALTMAIMLAPLTGLLVSWSVFYRQFGIIGTRLADLRWQTLEARLELATIEAGDTARRRWNAAGLREALDLLRGIADGHLDPAAPDVRRRCMEAERYLRQISSLAPDGALMSWWLALALAEAKSTSVRLRLHAHTLAVHDAQEAEAIGQIVLACLATTPPDSDLTVSLLEHYGAPRLFVVGGDQLLEDDTQLPTLIDRFEVSRQEFGEQVLVEATWQR